LREVRIKVRSLGGGLRDESFSGLRRITVGYIRLDGGGGLEGGDGTIDQVGEEEGWARQEWEVGAYIGGQPPRFSVAPILVNGGARPEMKTTKRRHILWVLGLNHGGWRLVAVGASCWREGEEGG